MNEPIKKIAVLIVEDKESDAQLIVRLFKKADYELVYEQVETAEQMRAALDQRAWDIVISDYSLPQFDGRAALKLLQDTGRDIPFIVVSGTIGEETAVAMMRAGVHDYLIKGNLTRLIPAVERELEQSVIRRARKQAEEALKESEEKYRKLVQDLPDAIAIYIDGKIVFANNTCVELIRAKNAVELLGRSVIDFVHPDSKEFVINRMLKVIKEGKSLPLAEEKFVRLDGTDVNVEVKALPITFEKKSAVQLIVRDITERKQAEEALRESEERYHSLFDRMLDGMYRSTHAGKFVDVNPAMVKMFGYSSREEMLEMDIKSELYFDSKERGTHIMDTGHGETDVYRLRRKDGSEIWVEDRGTYAHDEQGEIVFHEGIMRDVTARMQAEKALAASEAELRTLVEQVPATVYTESAENRETLYISPQVEKLTGYTSAEWIKDRDLWKQIIHPEDLAALLAEDERTTATHEPFRIEYRILTRDGRTLWIRDQAVMIEDQDGTPLFWQGVMYDITERKQAEEALAASEAELRALFASMQDVVMVIDREGMYREIAPTNPGLLVKPAAELLGKNLRDVFPAEQAETFIGAIRQVLDTNQTSHIEYKLLIGDKSMWFETSISPMDKDSTLWVARDVSRRKQADEILRESEERQRFIFEALPVAIFSSPVNPDYDTTWISGDVKKITGFENDEYLSENDFWRKHLHPEDKERVLNAYKNFPPNGEMILEYRWRCKDDQYRWFHDRAILLENESKQEYLGVIVDITERKRVEETLRQSESNLKKAQRFAHIGSWLWNIKTNELEWSDEMYHIFGINKETFSGALSDVIAQSIHPDDRYKVEQSNLSVINEAKPIPVEYRVIWSDGSEHVVWAEAGELILDETRHSSVLSGTVQDITFRKQAEETLRASEEQYRELFNSMIDGFALHEIICDEDGKPVDYRFLEANPAYERLTGFQSANLIGKTVLEVLPKTESYWIEIYGNVALTGRSTFFENYSGELGRYFEISAYCPRPGQFAAILVDITERKRTEEDMRQRVTELELLYESGLALSQLLDPKEIGKRILELLEEKLGLHHTRIRLYHPQDDRLEVLAFNQPAMKTETERHAVEEHLNRLIARSGDGLSGWAMQQSKTICIGDVRNNPHYIETYPGIRSGLYTPMKLGDRMIGVISIENEQPDAFSEADEQLISTLANQAASAFENARLFEETRRRVAELETLNRIALALRVVSKQAEMLNIILDEALAILDTSHGSIQLYNKTTDNLDKTILRGWTAQVAEQPHNSGVGITGKVFTSGEAYISREFASDPMVRAESRDQIPLGWGGICLPVRTAQQTLGVMIVSVPSERELDRDETRLLSIIAEMAGAALQRMQLHDETARRAEEFASLYETSKIISTENELDSLLQSIVEHAQTLLHSDSSGIYLYDAKLQEVKLVVYTGSYISIGEHNSLGEGAAGRVAQTRLPLRIDDYSTWEGRLPELEGVPFRAVLTVPMLYGGELIGVLMVDETGDSERKFFEADERLLTLSASQAAGAIHSARLYKETARRAEEFASLYETSKIISAENELDSLLQSIVEHAQTLLHSDSSGIYLYDEQHQEVEMAVYTAPYISIGTRLGLGESAAGRVVQTRLPLRIEDYSTWEDRSPKYAGVPFRAVMDVPMLYGGELIGVLVVDEVGNSTRKFTEADEHLLSLFASQAAGAIHSARLYKETVHRLERLQALRVVDQAISSSLDMHLTLSILLTHTLPQLNVDAADVFLFHADSNLLELMAGRGFHTLLLESISLSDSLAGRAIMERRTITLSDLEIASLRENQQFEKFWKEEKFSACWCVPLIVKGKIRGVLEVYRRAASTPDSEWLEFLETLAGQAAITIDNTQLFENLQRANMDLILAYNATIEGWSRAMELRDNETEGHTQQVANLTVTIAKAMGLPDQEMLHIRRGALLHDIGKMGIPDTILLKPDTLTDEEWVIMRMHPKLARDLLMPIANLREALVIPYCHHENWDGTGYPQGLKGEQIPLMARLFAIVDVWDALTNNRPYRKKWTKKKTLAYIQEQRGKRFDPQVVDVFLKIVK